MSGEKMCSICILDERLYKSFESQRSGDLIGKVHSIFNEVVNFISPDGLLLFSLATHQVIQSPRMMKTTDTVCFKKMITALEVNDFVYLRENKTFEVEGWQWTYKDANSWSQSLQTLPTHSVELTRSKLNVLNDFINEKGATSGSFYAWKQWSEPSFKPSEEIMKSFYFAPFVKAIERLDHQVDIKDLRTMLDGFIGLGIGLTPSGDDFLTGVLATWQYFNFSIANETLALHQEEWLSSVQGKTTDVSYFMLMHCLRGEVNEALLNLFEHFSDDLEPYLADVLAIGSTSGTDMLTGVSFAYEQLLRNKEEIV